MNLQLPSEVKTQITTRLRDEAIRIFSRCLPTGREVGSETGLVVGYVQSGKTMSFTTVAALARELKAKDSTIEKLEERILLIENDLARQIQQEGGPKT